MIESYEELLTRWQRDFALCFFRGYSPKRVLVRHFLSGIACEIPTPIKEENIVKAIHYIDERIKNNDLPEKGFDELLLEKQRGESKGFDALFTWSNVKQ